MLFFNLEVHFVEIHNQKLSPKNDPGVLKKAKNRSSFVKNNPTRAEKGTSWLPFDQQIRKTMTFVRKIVFDSKRYIKFVQKDTCQSCHRT